MAQPLADLCGGNGPEGALRPAANEHRKGDFIGRVEQLAQFKTVGHRTARSVLECGCSFCRFWGLRCVRAPYWSERGRRNSVARPDLRPKTSTLGAWQRASAKGLRCS